jgi:DHA2 family methylenomycin A resistance protein-like MFS transporter
VFLVGLAAFALTSAGCAAAPGVGPLIAFRAAQGIAGAAVLVSSLALLTHTFAGPDRARAVGIWSAVAGTALVLGPVCGGLLVDGPGWRSVFWINVPVCAASALAGRLLLADSRSTRRRRLDPAGQLVAVATLGAFGVGLSWAAAGRGRSFGGWAMVLAGVVGILAFVVLERRVASPLVPLALLRDRAGRTANATAFIVNFSTVGLLFLLSVYFERAQGTSSAGAGLRIAPLFAAYALASMGGGRLTARLGPRRPAGAGAALAGAAVLTAVALNGDGGAFVVALAVAGAGVGLAMPALVATAVSAVPNERIGLASGLNNTARQVGGALGVAVLGGVVAGAPSITAGTRAGLAVVAVCYLLAAAPCALLPGRPDRDGPGPATTKVGIMENERPNLAGESSAVAPGPGRPGEWDPAAPAGHRPSRLGLLGPEPPDVSTLGSVAEGRELVDELDDLLRDLIALRRRVAWRIQTLRLADGGTRIEIGREHDVTRRFVEALGPAGGELAVALFLLCRGPAPTVDLPPAAVAMSTPSTAD